MSLIVNQGNWCQATVSTNTLGIRTAASILRREGYKVSVSSMGNQVTSLGMMKMTLISISKGNHDDTFEVSDILRNHILELRQA